MRLSQRQKRILRWVGYPLLALFTFVIVLHLTFPYDRVVNKYVVEPLSDKYEVTFMDVDRGFWPGSITVKSLSLRSLDAGDDGEDGTKLFFKKVDISLGLLALTGGRANVDFVAKLGGGSIEGNVQVSRTEFKTNISTRSLPLANLGGVRTAVGLPMSGGLNASVDISMEEFRWDKLSGTIELGCSSCTIGDGVAKIKPRAPRGRRISKNAMVFAGDGLTVPELELGELSGTMVIKDGRGTIDDFSARSDDGELALSAAIRFTRKVSNARFDSGCMKFRLSDSLKKREAEFGNLPVLMKVSPESDGFSNVKLKGLVKGMRWVPTKNCRAGGGEGGERITTKRPTSRPRIKPKKEGDDEDDGITPEGRKSRKINLDDRKSKLGEVIKRENGRLDGSKVTVPKPRTSGPPIGRPATGDDVPNIPTTRNLQKNLLNKASGLKAVEGDADDEDEDDEDEDEDDEDDEDEDDEDEDDEDEDEDDEPARVIIE